MNNNIIYFMFLVIFFASSCDSNTKQVVVYTALDREFSEPILKIFEEKTGITVLAKYDSESTKSVGLTACIIEEKDVPRCDVFWNNEIVNTVRLKQMGLLDTYTSPSALKIPEIYKDKEHYWTGFAARARVLIVNTEKVAKEEYPNVISDLLNPKWHGKIAIAKPIAGTTATHISCLFQMWGKEKAQDFLQKMKTNNIFIASGNKQCARKVADGEIYMALTDTDDAIIEMKDGKPVDIIYLDSCNGELGTLFIPNTLALIKNAPHQVEGKKLIDFLLSLEVENMLAQGPSAQIPLNVESDVVAQVKTPKDIQNMEVDFENASLLWEDVRNYIIEFFLP